jgi:uncharacterized protein YjiS (DUF1127 family)
MSNACVERTVVFNSVGARPRLRLAKILVLTGLGRLWAERERQRQALARLDARLLADVGISQEQARREATKPFWRR